MENSKPVEKYHEQFKVHTYEVDLYNRLTIQSLCQFLQEAASNHASQLGLGVEYLLENNRTWVLSRLSVLQEKAVLLGETITIKTWPAGNEKFFFIRDFEIKNSRGKLIGKATSYWLFLDTVKKRPLHPLKSRDDSDVMKSLRLYKDIPRSFNQSLEKIPPLTKDVLSKTFTVRYSDLDLNNHVNNITYIAWALEGIKPDYRKNYFPVSLELNFLAEVRYGEEVKLSMENIEEKTFLHSLSVNNSEVCRVKTAWEKI